MTKDKRFYLNEGEVGILKILDLKEDSENIYLTSSKLDMERVVELLNKSHDENKQLKEQLADVNELNSVYVDVLKDLGISIDKV